MSKLLLFFFSHRTLALLRWDIHFMGVRFRNMLFMRHRVVDRFFKQQGPKYLNLGSGPRGKVDSSWLNIDGYPDKNVHYFCDFSRPMPVPDESLDGIFTEHVVEHFDYVHGKELLTQCHRMLKKGGVIRIIVPHGRTFMKAYFDEPQRIVTYKECETGQPMEAVNKWFYQRYEHQCIYDGAYLTDLLRKIGYSEAWEVGFRTTKAGAEALLLDDEKYAWESLYVEAVR